MIPKIIHYCWFGGKPLPKMARKCLASWKKYCPDYEIKEWNETNYDLTRSTYVREAAEVGKWAFVSDYVRFDVLNEYGGIYLDTDVEFLKSPDDFLHYPLFCGWEKKTADAPQNVLGSMPEEDMFYVVNYGSGVGAVAGHPIIKELLALFDEMHFKMPDGSLNMTTGPVHQTRVMQRFGLDATQPTLQITDQFATFPPEYFCPKDCATQEVRLTTNTVSIHHFDMSWFKLHLQCRYKILRILRPYLPHSTAYFIAKVISRLIYWKR